MQPHEDRLQPRSSDTAFSFPLVGSPVFGPDGDLVASPSRRLSILPFLLVGDQTPLDEDVVQNDVHHDVMVGVDVTTRPLATAHDVLRVQWQTDTAAPASSL